MPNMKSVIENHNTNLLSNHTTVAARSCICRQKSECSLNNKCLSESLAYKATVSQTPSEISKCYYGTCEKTFKERYNNHAATFRNKSQQESTELFRHISELKGNTIQHQISWDIASRARLYNVSTRKCDLQSRTYIYETLEEFSVGCIHHK